MMQLSWLYLKSNGWNLCQDELGANFNCGDLLGCCFKLESVRDMGNWESNSPYVSDPLMFSLLLLCCFWLTASYLWFRHFRITVHEALLFSVSSLCLRVVHARVTRVRLFHLMYCRPAQF